MIHTRRQFALTFLATSAAASLARASTVVPDDDLSEVGEPPNTFISPCGQPFRAKAGDPYPVVNWFKQADKNGDGKLDRAEFVDDAAFFFNVIDFSKQAFLSPSDVSTYEHRVAPEVLGYKIRIGAAPVRLWLAQMSPDQRGHGDDSSPGGSVPPPRIEEPHSLDESKDGASPYSFFDEPEPVAAADFNFNGHITLANFLKLADKHFTDLDPDDVGFLTLDTLPKTTVQETLERAQRGKRGKRPAQSH